jgi:ligand-binding sensor domain-containing protein
MVCRLAAAATVAVLVSMVSGTARANDMACVIPGGGSAAPFCVDGSGIAPLDGKEKAPFTFIRHVAVCGARLVVANTSEVAFREGGGGWTKPARHGKPVMGALGCDAKGTIFIGHKDGIAKFEGGQWIDTPYAAVNVTNGTLDGVKRFVTKPDGSLWAVLGRSLARYEGGEWKAIADLPPFPNEHVRFSDAAADKDGRLWLTHSGGLSMHDGKAWTAFKENLAGPSGIAIDGSGAVWISVNDGIRTFSGGAWKRALIGGMEPQIKPRDLAFDGKGRLWIASSWGLGVVENNVAKFWRMANSDVPFDDMRTLIVAGKGPDSLPKMQDKPTGGIKGKLEGDENAGLADVRVEFCNVRLSRFSTFKSGDTPCSTQAPLTFTTRTAKDGTFNIEKVPPGDYSITVEREAGKWVLLTGNFGVTAESVRVTSGKVTSIPTITVKAK